ncbi:MAG: hypothetical protein ACRDD0_08505 [Bacteroidales bacterium]
MTKKKQLKEMQARLPERIMLFDETSFDFTEDEYISMLCWIKYFNKHYALYGMNRGIDMPFAIISKRMHLDFGLYNIPHKHEALEGDYFIYISESGKCLDGKVRGNTIKKIVSRWSL